MKWIFHFDSFDVLKINFHKGHIILWFLFSLFCVKTNIFPLKINGRTFQFLVKFSEFILSLYGGTFINETQTRDSNRNSNECCFFLGWTECTDDFLLFIQKINRKFKMAVVWVYVCFPWQCPKMSSKFSSMNSIDDKMWRENVEQTQKYLKSASNSEWKHQALRNAIKRPWWAHNQRIDIQNILRSMHVEWNSVELFICIECWKNEINNISNGAQP